jgi:ParB-like chromosome segregation protein Spo0J
VETELVNISQIKKNPSNPRTIKDDKFKKLTQSIKELPQMLFLRPIVVNDDMVVLGGNMRLKACKEAGLKEVPVIKARDLTEEQQREFIIKDNVGFGEWDWDLLANEWDTDLLSDWGLTTWDTSDVDLDNFFTDDESEKQISNKIILEYSEIEYQQVIELFSNLNGSKESIVLDLLQE